MLSLSAVSVGALSSLVAFLASLASELTESAVVVTAVMLPSGMPLATVIVTLPSLPTFPVPI